MAKLPSFLEKIGKTQEEEKKEFFWALVLWEDVVKSAVWTVEEEKTKVVTIGGGQEWDGENLEGLIAAVDESFIFCSQSLEGWGEEPDKIVFGLPEDWIEKEDIKKDRQNLLSKLCQKLDLKPVGFVSSLDAIVFHLKKLEGIPLSAILVRPGRKKVLVAVCQVGKILKVEEVVSSGDLAADTCEGLLRFEEENLPSRILVFNSGDMEEARQRLTAFSWEAARAGGKKLPFLHFPKIEVLPADFDINAVCLAGGTEVAKSLGFTILKKEKRQGQEEEVRKPEKTVSLQEKPPPEVLEDEVAIPEKDLGFIKDKDILQEEEQKEGQLPEEERKPEEEAKEEEEEIQKPRFSLGLSLALLFSGLKQKLSFSFLPLSSFLVTSLVVFLLATGLFLGFIWYYPEATIDVLVSPKVLEEETLITVDLTQESLDEEAGILPGRLVEIEKKGERQKETTGQKTVGEKATGEVIIYNRTATPETFSQGTILAGPGGLKFSLDREVMIASKTPDLESGVDKWGEVSVEVKAVEIGAQYNLASQSQFTIEGFPSSSFLAKNQEVFGGGTSRQIQAVSQEDQDQLLELLKKDLEEQARTSLPESLSQHQKLIASSLAARVKKKDFSHQVGDETSTLSLAVLVEVSGVTYKEDDLARITQHVLKKEIPENYELRESGFEARFEEKERRQDGSFLFEVFIKVDLLPKIDKEEALAKVKGKRPRFVQAYFEDLPGFVSSEVKIRPSWLPSFLQFMPRSKEKITIEVRSN